MYEPRVALFRTCAHEAGHTVIAQKLNVPVTTVAVSMGHGGYCDFESGHTAQAKALILLAGATAEGRAFGQHVEPEGVDVPDGDPDWIAQQQILTEILVTRFWGDICILTVQLISEGTGVYDIV